MKKCFLFITGIVLPCLFLAAQKAPQSKALTVGDRVPELYFKEMINYSKGSARLSDFKDKVVILDFWATWCPPCVTGLVHLSSLQPEFKNDLMVVPINDGAFGDARPYVADFLKKRKDIPLPTCYDDSGKLNEYFPHGALPYCVVIGKDRTVKAITKSGYITKEYLRDIAAGKRVDLPIDTIKMLTDPTMLSTPAFVQNMQYSCQIFGFVHGYFGFPETPSDKTFRMALVNCPIITLYGVAFQHTDYPLNGRVAFSNPRDSILLTMPSGSEWQQDEWMAQNSYCFGLTIPMELAEKRYELMKKELDNYFGAKLGLHPRLETRKMNCLKLVAVDDTATIRMKSEKEFSLQDHSPNTFSFRKTSMRDFLATINSTMYRKKITTPFINASEYEGPISFGFNTDGNNYLDELKKAVQKIGLRIEETEGDVEFIVF